MEMNSTLSLSPVPAEAVDEVMRRVQPSRVLELGMHCGYTSVRLLRLLPPAGTLVTVEGDPLTAELGEEIILVAGFKHSQVHSGASRYTQVHPSTPSNEAFISDKSQSEKRIALKKNVSLRGFNPSSCAPLILCSSRCWHLVQLRPYQHCVLFLSLIKGPVRGSVWCWWTTTPSGTFQTCWLYRERSSSAHLAALSSWSTGTKELKVSEKSWTTSERDPTATTSSQSSSLWQRSSTRRKRDDGKI